MSILKAEDFDPCGASCLGLEIEFGLFESGTPVPASQEFLEEELKHDWTDELPAWQVEARTRPTKDHGEIEKQLKRILSEGKDRADQLDLEFGVCEVTEDRPETYEISPKPRYEKIRREQPEETWKSGCRVAGTHIHYGCESPEHALEVYNRLAAQALQFYRLGEHSREDRSSRLELYKTMAPCWKPPTFESLNEWEADARESGYVNNLRDCWYLVRITPHGTVEVRSFGVTMKLEEIMHWIRKVEEVAESS